MRPDSSALYRETPSAFVGGGGALVFDPTGKVAGSVPGAEWQAKGGFVYGGGVDFDLTPRVAFRAEYRGLVYKFHF